MKNRSVKILSTRHLDNSLLEKSANNKIHIDTIPFIQVRKSITESDVAEIAKIAQQEVTVIFTSVNAVEAVVDTLPPNEVMPLWRIYCIGGSTFTMVKKYWNYDRIIKTATNAMELANSIVEQREAMVTWFCSNIRRDELPLALKQAAVALKEIIVYETIESPQKVSEDYDAVLFFSPSAVNSFFKNNAIVNEKIFVIGKTTADAVSQFTDAETIISDFPSTDQLIDKVIWYFQEG